MQNKNYTLLNKGFTLIEILVVMGMIAVLAVIVLIAINPARQFAQSRNTQRTSNVNAILNAIGQRVADNKGVFPGSGCTDIPSSAVSEVTAVRMGEKTNQSYYDIAECLVPTYITSMPFDPSTTTPTTASWATDDDYDTGYSVYRDTSGRVTVCAMTVEPALAGTGPICITR
ncbi:MAG: type II secretion system protein [Candidatus Doudnabacteria bacterium]|nr:type II secretion system protein [Candidatus Doudnabacteria bacterium]